MQRVALYPDPLLAQILAGATYSDQIPDAARWADQHHYLTGQALASAITGDQLPWDPSLQALLPFPSVLDMMASDLNWTRQLGDAFLAQQLDVMDAVQRDRRRARDFGYLRTNPQIVVGGGPYITIDPVRPDYLVVPAYYPAVVFFAPRPGFVVGGAIRFGYGVTIGGFFRPWGWGVSRFDWGGLTRPARPRPLPGSNGDRTDVTSGRLPPYRCHIGATGRVVLSPVAILRRLVVNRTTFGANVPSCATSYERSESGPRDRSRQPAGPAAPPVRSACGILQVPCPQHGRAAAGSAGGGRCRGLRRWPAPRRRHRRGG